LVLVVLAQVAHLGQAAEIQLLAPSHQMVVAVVGTVKAV
jgi:hypothetical protein